MPTYSYRCDHCGHRFERLLPLARFNEPQSCAECEEPATKVLAAPYVRGDYEGYLCPVTERWIEGRAAHEENLRRTGCRVYEPGETQARIREKAREEANFDRAVEETVERVYEALPTEKKETLAREVAAGATATVERL